MQTGGQKKIKSISYAKYGYFFILPFFIVYAFFMIYPLINTFMLSFKGNGDNQAVFVGFQNYQYLLAGGGRAAKAINEEFWRSFGNTLILWLGNFVIQIVLSLLLAVWFSDMRIKIKGTGFFKVIMYLPNILTAASIAGLFLILFGNSKYGAVNSLLLKMNWIQEAFPFLGKAWSSRFIVMFIQSWMWFGNTMLLLMSGIFGIDPSIYEAASIDGASGSQTFFRITMPILKPIFIYVLITSMIGGLQMFDIPYLMHEEPNMIRPELETLAVFIYRHFHLSNPNYGYSAAASVLLFILTAALGMFIYKFNTAPDAPVKKKKKAK